MNEKEVTDEEILETSKLFPSSLNIDEVTISIDNSKLKVCQSDCDPKPHTYRLCYEIGKLDLFEDEQGRVWINKIETHGGIRRRGIAELLIKNAISEYDEIYVSDASPSKHFKEGLVDIEGRDDTRGLEIGGVLLVKGLIKKRIRGFRTLDPFYDAESRYIKNDLEWQEKIDEEEYELHLERERDIKEEEQINIKYDKDIK